MLDSNANTLSESTPTPNSTLSTGDYGTFHYNSETTPQAHQGGVIGSDLDGTNNNGDFHHNSLFTVGAFQTKRGIASNSKTIREKEYRERVDRNREKFCRKREIEKQAESAKFYSAAENKFRSEFIEESAIAPGLFEATVELLPDFRLDTNGDPEFPIADALGWKVSRFGRMANQSNFAAALRQESGGYWQLKLSKPRAITDENRKAKVVKYECVRGSGGGAYLPPVPADIRRKIGERYGLEVPSEGSFWDWLETRFDVPIVFTEGAKKALALLSKGYAAIALTGVNGGYRTGDGRPFLIPDVARFVGYRSVALAFDQDISESTRRRVNLARRRFGGLIARLGSSVTVVSWESVQGKGVDDLIAGGGVEAWETALSNALPLTDWAIVGELKSRLTKPSNLSTNAPDLSTISLSGLPESGIIAIASAKGTGKTKAMAGMVDCDGGNLSLTHRRALGRNLAARLSLPYRDLVSDPNNRIAVDNAGFFRLGVTGCVDWLLAIDPAAWRGGTLFIDEVTQVVRHLLTSRTCSQDGKRPILLAKFRELIAGAKRVIVADADLDNTTLDYIAALRGDGSQPFLIRNDYQGEGYPVEFIQSGSRDEVVGRLIEECGQIPAGQAVYIAVDSRRISQQLELILGAKYPHLNILTVNSDTSGSGDQRAFVENPDSVLATKNYQIIIGTPSIGTGVSIESHGAIASVWGIFQGVSITDADMSQALDRVREPVRRVVWCSAKGSAFSKVGRSSNPLQIKGALKERTDATVRLLASQLREDSLESLKSYDWESDPHLNAWARIEADRNRSMFGLGDRLRVRLGFEGKRVAIVKSTLGEMEFKAIKELLKEARETIRATEAKAIAAAPKISKSEAIALAAKPDQSPEDKAAIASYWLRDFYRLEDLTEALVLADKEGQTRAQISSLENLLYPETADDRTLASLEGQLKWNAGNCPWDISSGKIRQQIRTFFGLTDFLKPDREWTAADLAPYAEKIKADPERVKSVLNMTIKPDMSDTQLVHQLLSQLGIALKFRQPRIDGKRVRVYRVDADRYAALSEIVERRRQHRLEESQKLAHPPLIEKNNRGGVPLETPPDTPPNLPNSEGAVAIAPAAEVVVGAAPGAWVQWLERSGQTRSGQIIQQVGCYLKIYSNGVSVSIDSSVTELMAIAA